MVNKGGRPKKKVNFNFKRKIPTQQNDIESIQKPIEESNGSPPEKRERLLSHNLSCQLENQALNTTSMSLTSDLNDTTEYNILGAELTLEQMEKLLKKPKHAKKKKSNLELDSKNESVDLSLNDSLNMSLDISDSSMWDSANLSDVTISNSSFTSQLSDNIGKLKKKSGKRKKGNRVYNFQKKKMCESDTSLIENYILDKNLTLDEDNLTVSIVPTVESDNGPEIKKQKGKSNPRPKKRKRNDHSFKKGETFSNRNISAKNCEEEKEVTPILNEVTPILNNDLPLSEIPVNVTIGNDSDGSTEGTGESWPSFTMDSEDEGPSTEDKVGNKSKFDIFEFDLIDEPCTSTAPITQCTIISSKAAITTSQNLMPPPCVNLDESEIVYNIIEDSGTCDENVDLLIANPRLSLDSSSVGAYLGYVCAKDPSKCTIAVCPEFSSNRFFNFKKVKEMDVTKLIINPLRIPFSRVNYVIIPVMANFSTNSDYATLHSSVGHFILGIFDVRKKEVHYLDPFGGVISREDIAQLRLTVSSLPGGLACSNFNIRERKRDHFNAQPGGDGINCGHFVCLYSELSVMHQFQTNIKLENFDIVQYKMNVIGILNQIVNNRVLPPYASFGSPLKKTISKADLIKALSSVQTDASSTAKVAKKNNDVTPTVLNNQQSSAAAAVNNLTSSVAEIKIQTRSLAKEIEKQKETLSLQQQQQQQQQVPKAKEIEKQKETLLVQQQQQQQQLQQQQVPKAKPLKTKGLCEKRHPGRYCAMHSANHTLSYYNSGKFDHKCPHCNALLLKSEAQGKASKCCNNGKVDLMDKFLSLQNRPEQLDALCTEGHPLSEMFLRNSRRYNTEFSFGSIHTKEEHSVAKGIPVCKINGETSYELSDLFAQDHLRPSFAQIYALEPLLGQAERNFRADKDNKLNKKIMSILDDCMRKNHALASTYKWAAELFHEKEAECEENDEAMPAFRLIILTNREAKDYGVADKRIHKHRTESATAEQVALVWTSDEGNPPNVSGIRLYGRKGGRKFMNYYDPNVDPAVYPMLFPRGQQGYSFGIKLKKTDEIKKKKLNKRRNKVYDDNNDISTISSDDDPDVEPNPQTKDCEERNFLACRPFYRYLMQMRPRLEYEDFMSSHWLWEMRSIAELFVMTTNNKIEQHEMQWSRKVQEENNKRSIYPEELKKGLAKRLKPGQTLGKLVFGPTVWKGSRRYMQNAYADLRTMTDHLGEPSLFLTFTGNPNWPEIQEALLPGQLYTQRPDVVVRVFQDKVKELVKDVYERHIFGPCTGYYYVVEFQKRGMPHIHMVIFLKDDPKHHSEEFVDDLISAEIPDLPDEHDKSPEAEEKRELHRLVTKLQLHDCNENCTDDSGKCSKHFPKKFQECTILHSDDYPEYLRRPPVKPGETKTALHGNSCKGKKGGKIIDNSRVVPYNEFIIKKYRTHSNLEIVTNSGYAEYLSEYITKGHDAAYVGLQEGNVVDYDEITHAFKVRFMSPMEAMWRLYCYYIVKKSHDVMKQWVYGPQGTPIVFQEGFENEAEQDYNNYHKLNMVEAFFELCKKDPEAKNLTYDKLGLHYYFNKRDGIWVKRKNTKNLKIFVRVGSVSPSNRQLFCMRHLLLSVKGPTSFEDLRTFKGEVCESFEQACQRMGIIDSDTVWLETLRNAKNERMGIRAFIRFFAQVIYFCVPIAPRDLFDSTLELLIPGKGSVESKRRKALKYLQYYFREWNTTCEEMGLIKVDDFDYEQVQTELENDPDLFNYDEDIIANRKPNWSKIYQDNYNRFNIEQKQVFDSIKAAVEANPSDRSVQRLFFVQGSGGTGKTFVYNTIIAWAKSIDKKVLACASTGIAALLLDGGATAHSCFRIPNDVRPEDASRVEFQGYFANNLRKVSVIIIDEITMLHKVAFEYIDKVMQSLQPRNQKPLPFGGATVLVGGDFKQMLPVVINGGRIDQFQACVKTSNLFKTFKKLCLMINMRVDANELAFAQFLENVGNGENFIEKTSLIQFPPELFVPTTQHLIDFSFPPRVLEYPHAYCDELSNSVILAPTNRAVDDINDAILASLSSTSQSMRYQGLDSLIIMGAEDQAVEGLRIDVSDNMLERIHRKTPSGMPPFMLVLKEGAIIMLLKNISVSQGLCNGARLQIKKMTPYILHCKLLTGTEQQRKLSEEVTLTRIRFNHGTSASSTDKPFCRIQFPIRLAFAMTINKSQGQTFERMGLAMDRQQIFTHGQLYVALSRVRRYDSIRILVAQPKILEGHLTLTDEQITASHQIRNMVHLDALV